MQEGSPLLVTTTPEPFTVVEVCSGAGGLALGLETAGFTHTVCVDSDAAAAATIRGNRPEWAMTETDLRDWEPTPDCHHPDVFAGGVPCPRSPAPGNKPGTTTNVTCSTTPSPSSTSSTPA